MRPTNPAPVTATRPFPRSVDALVAELEETYPEFIPTPGTSPEQIMFRAGQRALVTELRRRLDKANTAD